MSILWNGSFGLHVIYDSGMADDVDTRKYTSVYALTLDDGIVLWCSRLQRIVKLHMIEPEYMLVTEASKEAILLVFIKHIDVRYYFIREVIDGCISLQYYRESYRRSHKVPLKGTKSTLS